LDDTGLKGAEDFEREGKGIRGEGTGNVGSRRPRKRPKGGVRRGGTEGEGDEENSSTTKRHELYKMTDLVRAYWGRGGGGMKEAEQQGGFETEWILSPTPKETEGKNQYGRVVCRVNKNGR